LSRVSHDDVLFGYRLQLFDLAGRTSVGHACRTFGVHSSTCYRWKAQVDRHGLEVLRPRERRSSSRGSSSGPALMLSRLDAWTPSSGSSCRPCSTSLRLHRPT
jgi:hypothetical protein